MDASDNSFEKKFATDLKHSDKSLLSYVILKNGSRSLTEHHSHWVSHQDLEGRGNGVFDFSDRFDAEEVEWFLNKPLDIIEGRTCIHAEVFAQRVVELASLMRLGGTK